MLVIDEKRSRTDAILAAVRDELERQRAHLDRNETVQRIDLIVRLTRAGRPCRVVFRTEGEREVGP